MSKVVFCGMGKLGFPCALAAASRGHDVVGYDVSPAAKEILRSRKYPHREERAQELLETTTLRIVDTVDEAVAHADIVLVAVQTPHQPEFEGITRMPEHRADFDYTALKAAVASIAEAARREKKYLTIVVISTCLPGTCEREVYPLLNEYTEFAYTPYFIAMGTTVPDFLNPEFVLIGLEQPPRSARRAKDSLWQVQNFYYTLHGAPQRLMSVASAELTKVAYNVFLGLKIVAANSVMEIAHKVGANCDDVTNALALATDRVVSAKYMRGGMGDGGGCHPRDQIALSWLAQKLRLSCDLFAAMIKAREAQTEWLVELASRESQNGELPIAVLGKAYKRGTNLTIGSPAILLKNLLDEVPHLDVAIHWDPHVDGTPQAFTAPHVFIVATDHDEFFSMDFPKGSVVIDPWGKMMPNREGVKVVRVGRQDYFNRMFEKRAGGPYLSAEEIRALASR